MRKGSRRNLEGKKEEVQVGPKGRDGKTASYHSMYWAKQIG